MNNCPWGPVKDLMRCPLQTTQTGGTPLILAASMAHIDVVELLLIRGAKVDLASSKVRWDPHLLADVYRVQFWNA